MKFYLMINGLPKGISALIILILFTISGNAFAQLTFQEAIKNYQHGIVIPNTGDTIHGQIDNREWSINPSTIEFVQKDKKKTFTATDIKGFQVGDNTYRSAKIDLDVSPLSLRHLTTSPVPTIAHDTTLFLLLVAQGKVKLYYLMDAANKRHFFFQKNGRDINELGYYKHYKNRRREPQSIPKTRSGPLSRQ